jgi:hypothetical protein
MAFTPVCSWTAEISQCCFLDHAFFGTKNDIVTVDKVGILQVGLISMMALIFIVR